MCTTPREAMSPAAALDDPVAVLAPATRLRLCGHGPVNARTGLVSTEAATVFVLLSPERWCALTRWPKSANPGRSSHLRRSGEVHAPGSLQRCRRRDRRA